MAGCTSARPIFGGSWVSGADDPDNIAINNSQGASPEEEPNEGCARHVERHQRSEAHMTIRPGAAESKSQPGQRGKRN